MRGWASHPYLIHSRPISVFPIIGPSIFGTTQNAFLEFSNAISNVYHCGQCYSHQATTLGSVKIAVDGLSEPLVGYFTSLLRVSLSLLPSF